MVIGVAKIYFAYTTYFSLYQSKYVSYVAFSLCFVIVSF